MRCVFFIYGVFSICSVIKVIGMNTKDRADGKIIDSMAALGFAVNESRLYLALLKKHPATGYELSSFSGVPRSAVYAGLARLEDAGFINNVAKKPARYVPLPPEELGAMVKTRFNRHLDEFNESVKLLGDVVPKVNTWTLNGRESVMDRARSLITTAQKTVFGSIWQREGEELRKSFESAKKRGVEVVLFSFNPLPQNLGRILCYGIQEKELEKHWSHRIILVTDHRRALIGGAEQSGDSRAVFTEEETLVENALSNLLLDITLLGERKRVDVSETVKHLTTRLAPLEKILSEQSSPKNSKP